MKTGMRLDDGMRDFLKYLAIALCPAIVTYLTASCTAGLVIGHNQRQHQENNITTRVDSARVAPTITTSPQPQERNHFSDGGHWKPLFAKDKLSNY